MSKLTSSTYLRNYQYRDSKNLSARAGLHENFSVNKTGWQKWAFQQLELPPGANVLEIGAGPGYLWRQNRQNIGTAWQVFLTDLSQGMLEESRAALSGLSQFSYSVLDGVDLPFPEGFFDAVIANHVLYHLPVPSQALQEIERVLKPGCCLYAATNGEAHLKEIRDWKKAFLPESDQIEWGTISAGFNLENGRGLLEEIFPSVQTRVYPDRLEIDQVGPVLDYIESYTDLEGSPEFSHNLGIFLKNMLSEKGTITISKDTGMFLAAKR